MSKRTDNWHPRGEPTWPNWKNAAEGTRFEHVRTGRRGTFIKPSKNRNNGAIVEWDGSPRRSNVIAPAFDLRPIDEGELTWNADSLSRT